MSNFFFSQNVFYSNQKNLSPFIKTFDISLFAAEFEEAKIGMSGKGLVINTSI